MRFTSKFTNIPTLFAAGFFLISNSAYAVDIQCDAGGLKEACEEAGVDPATETSLTVSGSLNLLDFDFIRTMTALKELNLSETIIEAYSGPASEAGITSSDGDVLPPYALMSGRFTTFSFPAEISTIGTGALGNSMIENLVVPSSVTTIEAGAFANMENLKEVRIPSSVTSLPSMLFKDCKKLEKATIEANVATLPQSFFQNCPALTTVSLPSSLTAIGDYAFSGCTSLADIEFPNNLVSIGNYAFASCSSLVHLLTPTSLRSIGDWAFSGCQNLQSILFVTPVNSLGTGAFFNTQSLTTPLGDIAADVTAIPDYLLYEAPNVDASGFEHTSVETVGVRALSGNKSAAITLPASLNYLADNAMEDWTNLEKIEALALTEVPQLGSTVWEGVDQGSVILYIPQAMLADYKDAPQWQDFNIHEVSASNITLTDSDAPKNIRAAFDGMVLRVEADTDIRAAQLYDVAGRCLTIVNNYQSNRLTVDTAPFSTSVFIVRILLADSETVVLKLAR